MADTKRKWELLKLVDGKVSVRANGKELGIIPGFPYNYSRWTWHQEMERLLNAVEENLHG